jgi:hypothetical protein
MASEVVSFLIPDGEDETELVIVFRTASVSLAVRKSMTRHWSDAPPANLTS